MWEKVERTKSKELSKPDAKPGTPPTKPQTPAKPADPSKPPYPYTMSPSESKDYRWRWVEAQTANTATDTEDQWEAAAYTIEVLHGLGVTDVPAYVAKVERMIKQDQAFERRRLRIAAFTAR